MGYESDRECAQALINFVPRFMRAVMHEMRERGTGDQLTIPQFHVLHHLSLGDRLGTDLAKHLQVTTPTITSIIDGLEERGLVKRGYDPANRRAIPLSITPEGQRLFEETSKTAEAIVVEMISQLSEEQKRCLTGAIANLNASLEGDPPGSRAICSGKDLAATKPA